MAAWSKKLSELAYVLIMINNGPEPLIIMYILGLASDDSGFLGDAL